ncbi:MAG: Phosphoglycerate mutase family protein [candidate division WS6 bacterium GW2011_GWF2_39_15]|uniref:Phosphoglycerate mutase family protein n=1 Tax=candidate division WS6 bacterium GW2011_GWF2_39_15 TaxID=1619100 RepID=A0A0G0N0T8_9BACT|nr:MAG: Phosphoglycerate mutase family protein [candidate division WS6 bacterium GW2011_GWF2_39_15]
MKTIRLVRHGEAFSNMQGNEGEGKEKDSLTNEGNLQSQTFADSFNSSSTSLLIVSSMYKRAQQTANPLRVKYPNSAAETWEEVSEYYYLSDKLEGEAKKILRKEYWLRNDPEHRTDTDVENFIEFVKRVDNTIAKIKKSPQDEIVIFTHAKFMRLFLLRLVHRKNIDLKYLMTSLNGYKHKVDYCDSFKFFLDKKGSFLISEFE